MKRNKSTTSIPQNAESSSGGWAFFALPVAEQIYDIKRCAPPHPLPPHICMGHGTIVGNERTQK